MPEKYNTNPLRMFSFTAQGENPRLEEVLEEMSKQETLWEDCGLTYLKAAKEEGGDTDNLHYHIFLHSAKGNRYSYWQNTLTTEQQPLIDCKIINIKQTMEYIGNTEFVYSDKHPIAEKRNKKKGGVVHKTWEIGEISTVKIPRKGSNGNDLDTRLCKLQDLVKDGASVDELYEADFAMMVRYGKSIESYMAVFYGTKETKSQIADLKAMADQRAQNDKMAENRALRDMLMRLQDRIMELETPRAVN